MSGASPLQSASKLNCPSVASGRLIRSRTAFPTSSALPPPKAITASHPFSRYAWNAPSTSSSIGFGCTFPKISAPPSASSSSANAFVFSKPASVTTSGRVLLNLASQSRNPLRAPTPKQVVVGKENVESMGVISAKFTSAIGPGGRSSATGKHGRRKISKTYFGAVSPLERVQMTFPKEALSS